MGLENKYTISVIYFFIYLSDIPYQKIFNKYIKMCLENN